jgi:hypothetical protein
MTVNKKHLRTATDVGQCPVMRSKRVAIVFEEKTDGTFEVAMEGTSSYELEKLPQVEWSGPEFWGSMSFRLIMDFLEDAGIVRSIRERDKES